MSCPAESPPLSESWRWVLGGEGRYEVSSLGRIRDTNFRGRGVVKLLPGSLEGNGYIQVNLCLSGERVTRKYLAHRVVAQAFHANPYSLPVVNHKNGVKTDNSAVNTEWVTHVENANHAVATGLRAYNTYARQYPRQRVIQYGLDGQRIQEFTSIQGACRACKVQAVNIYKVCLGQRRHAGLFQWRFWRETSAEQIPSYTPKQRRVVPLSALQFGEPTCTPLPVFETPPF